jgi:hypothetical protein
MLIGTRMIFKEIQKGEFNPIGPYRKTLESIYKEFKYFKPKYCY